MFNGPTRMKLLPVQHGSRRRCNSVLLSFQTRRIFLPYLDEMTANGAFTGDVKCHGHWLAMCFLFCCHRYIHSLLTGDVAMALKCSSLAPL